MVVLDVFNCFAHDEPTHADEITEVQDHHDQLNGFEAK